MGGSLEGHEILTDDDQQHEQHTAMVIADMLSTNLPVITRSHRTTRHGKKSGGGRTTPYRAKAHDLNNLLHLKQHADGGSGTAGSPAGASHSQ